jgi:hypothetical protein
MAGLDPAIHVFDARKGKLWMPATSAGMTGERLSASLERQASPSIERQAE